MTDTDAFVTIREFSSEAEARLAQLNLESMGITVYMQKDDCGGAHPELQVGAGVRLQVAAAEVDLARSILAEVDAEADEKPLKPKPSKKSTLWSIFVVGLLAGAFLASVVFIYLKNEEKIVNDTLAYDTNVDGIDDEFLYRRNGGLVKSTEDRNHDGKPDAWYYFQGDLLARGEFDENFDSQVDLWTIYTDRNNFQTKIDTDFDGTPDVTSYVKTGVAQRADWHPGNRKTISRQIIFKDGIRDLEYIDTDKDGQFDQKCTFSQFEEKIGCEPYTAG